ncbi:MAG: TetR family transcriptional regulator [Alphaproteobacteria bacterium]|nr:TetR family transcriptional regulator [Alphaproteobacteria bacterium]
MKAAVDPRANQKERTRGAIVEAAIALLRSGAEVSVAAAAAEAKVSRATAYRYFPTPESLQIEAAGVTPDYAAIDEVLDAVAEEDAETRMLKLADAVNAKIFADEARMRLALKVYLDTWFANRGEAEPQVREGRRTRWIARALAPARTGRPSARQRRLEAALALTVGAEAMVVMKDVCRLDDKEAQATLRWAVQALLRAGLADLDEAKATKRR